MNRTKLRIRFAVGVILTTIAFQCPLYALPFRFLAWDNEIAARKIGLIDNSKVSELQRLHPYQRTKALNVAAGGTPLYLVANDRTDAEGKPATIEIKLTAGISAPLVIILPDPNHPTGLRPFVIDDSPKAFTWGSIRFVNASGKELMFRCDKSIVTLPATWDPIQFIPGGTARKMEVKLAAKDDLNTILYSAVWEHDTDIRKLVLIVPDTKPQSNRVSLKTIPENRRIIAKEAAAPQP